MKSPGRLEAPQGALCPLFPPPVPNVQVHLKQECGAIEMSWGAGGAGPVSPVPSGPLLRIIANSRKI